MNYRILAVDMDGTVLNSEKKISPRTEAAIHRAFEEGLQVVFCTGRNLIEVQPYLDLFPEMRYVILCSGGVVKDLQNGENLYHKTLDYDLAKQVIRETGEMDVNIVYQASIRSFSKRPHLRALFSKPNQGGTPREKAVRQR